MESLYAADLLSLVCLLVPEFANDFLELVCLWAIAGSTQRSFLVAQRSCMAHGIETGLALDYASFLTLALSPASCF